MNELTVNTRLDDLKRRYAIGLPEKVRKVVESVRASLAVPRDRVLLEIAHRVIHGLTGSSGTYGYVELSQVARRAELLLSDALESGSPPPPDRQLQVRELILSMGSLVAIAACEAD